MVKEETDMRPEPRLNIKNGSLGTVLPKDHYEEFTLEGALEQFRRINSIVDRAIEIIGPDRWKALSRTRFKENGPGDLDPSQLVTLLEQCLATCYSENDRLIEENKILEQERAGLNLDLISEQKTYRRGIEQVEGGGRGERNGHQKKIEYLKTDRSGRIVELSKSRVDLLQQSHDKHRSIEKN